MKNYFKNAKFLTTDFVPFSKRGNAWGEHRPALYQHTELVPCDGIPFYFKDFEIKKVEKSAIYFTALGCVDVYINGARIGTGEMNPGWTNYNKRVMYLTYDITSALKKGKNRILAVTAPGWYSGRISGGIYGYKSPSFAASIVSGGKEILFTDKTWFAAVGGEVRFSDIWDGEYIDASFPSYAEMSMADKSGKDKKKAKGCEYDGEITPFVGPEVRERSKLSVSPASLTVTDGTEYNGTYYGRASVCLKNATLPLTLKPGQKLTVDLGQEIVGRLAVEAASVKGNEVKIRYAEFLNDSGDPDRGNDGPEGSVYTINLRSALGREHYVFRDKNKVEFSTRFTF